MDPKKVAVIFGGRSGEHVVSLRSAASIMEAIDRNRFQVIQVGITRTGRWLTGENTWQCLWEQNNIDSCSKAVLLTDPEQPGLLVEDRARSGSWYRQPLDLVFPVLHGPFGEDGTVQGLLELAGLPYVGSGVLASAAGMDKVTMKALFAQHGLPIGDYLFTTGWEWADNKKSFMERVSKRLICPLFVKPANLGSSVGITRVEYWSELEAAIEEALRYDEKVLVESFVEGREIECSVLGDTEPKASLPGEIIPCNKFYDYQAKYLDERSKLVVPVKLGATLERKVQMLAVKSFQAVQASGLARVDFFVNDKEGEVIINEINTMPGFTSISMYPKLWEATGLPYRELVNKLLDLAVNRYRRRRKLIFTPPE